MGAAHATVINQSTRPLCVITFNMAELIYKSYHTLYIVMPGESQVVEANPDPIGLKVAIIYDTIRETQELLFHRFTCKNDSVLTVTMIEGTDIDYYGEGTNLQAKGRLKEHDVEPFNMAASTLNQDLADGNANGNRFENAALAASQGVKKILNKVKDSSEAAIKTVTGKEIKLELGSVSGGAANGFGNASRHSAMTPTNIPPPSPTQSFEDISQLTEDSMHYGMSNMSAPGSVNGGGGGWGGGGGVHPIAALRGPTGAPPPTTAGFPSSGGFKPPLGGNQSTASGPFAPTGIAGGSAAGKLFSNMPGAATSSSGVMGTHTTGSSGSAVGAGGDWAASQGRAGQGPNAATSSGAFLQSLEERRSHLSTTASKGPTAAAPLPPPPPPPLPSSSSAWAAAAATSSGSAMGHPSSSYAISTTPSPPRASASPSPSALAPEGGGGGGALSAEEKFAAELDRKRKEQRWEEEVRRIRREREEQARSPKSTSAALAAPGSGGVQTGCQCVVC